MGPVSHQNARVTAGRHTDPARGVCVMELASMLAGERFSDHPRSVSPFVASLLRGYNDGLDDARRQELKRFAADSIGTANGHRAERRRKRLVVLAWPADSKRARGLRAWFSHRLTAADPYGTARATAERVAKHDDDARHAVILAVFDELIAVGRQRPSPTVDAPSLAKALL